MARHFTEAGLVDPAIDYWLKAGHLALTRSANAEAVKHLGQGIELTQSQAPTGERLRKELDFYLALGPATAATEGYATPETLRVFSHARDLLGDRRNKIRGVVGIHQIAPLDSAEFSQHRSKACTCHEVIWVPCIHRERRCSA